MNSFNCSCSAGYTGHNCSVNIDECQSSPCVNNGKVAVITSAMLLEFPIVNFHKESPNTHRKVMYRKVVVNYGNSSGPQFDQM